MEKWVFGDNRGLKNPAVPNATSCPDDCGMCAMHTSHTGLANVDLTNRCNLTCPVCFANANVAGYVYEPDRQVRKMLAAFATSTGSRTRRPVLRRRADHPSALSSPPPGQGMGFSHIQAATNGIKFADLEFPEVQGSRAADALSPVRRRLRRRLQAHPRPVA